MAAAILGTPVVAGLAGYIIANLPEIAAQERQELEQRVENQLEEGFYQLHHGDPGLALPQFRSAIAMNPGSIEARGGLAMAWLVIGNPGSALDVLDQPTLAAPDAAALAALKADALKDLGRKQEARATRAAAPPPRSPLACFLAGLRAIRQGHLRGDNTGAGRRAFERARSFFINSVMRSSRARRIYHLELAHAIGHLGRNADPGPVANGLLGLWPQSAAAHRWSAFAYRPSSPERAIALYRESIRLDPTDHLALNSLGMILKAEGRLDEAVEVYGRSIAVCADDHMVQNNLGVALKAQGRFEEAVASYKTAISLAPEDGTAWFNLGIAYKAQGDLDAAIAAYRSAAKLEPDHPKTHYNLGLALKARDRLDEAAAALRTATRLKPDYYQAWNSLGLAERDRKRLHEAVSAFEAAIAANPRYRFAHINKIEALTALGLLAEARKALDASLVPLGDDPAHLVAAAGWLTDREGRADQQDPATAVTLVRKALQLSKKPRPGYLEVLARALAGTGDLSGAVQAQERVLRLLEGKDRPRLSVATARATLERYREASSRRR